MVLLAQDETGFGNLMKLSSLNYLDCGAAEPHVTLAALEAHAAGLICLTGGADGPLGALLAEGHGARARALAERLAGIFPGRLYVEIQRHPLNGAPRTPAEAATEPGLVGLAYDLDLPLVATNDVHFPARDLYDAHDALICIADGAYVDQQEARRRLTPEHYFKSQDEMVALFADLPEAVANTVEIARRCAFRPKKRKPILPRFADDEVEELRRQARAGLDARLAVIPHSAPLDTYRERLEFELGVIEGMGFPGYFLIVADFIKWAKERSIPVGPGRGSGAGWLVAYALTITDLDPLRYGLLFERFLNPERISMPDFDIDFCMDRREEVIAYVQSRYGRDRVAQIITFGALLSKAAVRDVGRVLQMPYGQVDRLSKLIPMEGVKPVSVEKALAEEPRLREEARRDPQVARLLEIARAIEGLLRNASTHAAGVVIGDRPLERAGAALPRPALGHAGDPVQHEVGRGSRAGEVRLPRAEDPDGDPERARPAEGARRRDRHRRDPARRPEGLRALRQRRDGGGVPGGIDRACAPRCASSSRPASRTSSRSSRSTGPGRWRTSRSSATSRTAARSATACIPRSTGSSTRRKGSSSTRSR